MSELPRVSNGSNRPTFPLRDIKTEQIAEGAGPARTKSSLSLISSKELLPWILAASHLLSWFGVKYLTSDRLQQQQQDDHVAIGEIRTQINAIDKGQSALGAKVDLILTLHKDK